VGAIESRVVLVIFATISFDILLNIISHSLRYFCNICCVCLKARNRSENIVESLTSNKVFFKQRKLILIALLAMALGQVLTAAHAAEHVLDEHPGSSMCLECLALIKDEHDYEFGDAADPESDASTLTAFLETHAAPMQPVSFVTTAVLSRQHDLRRSRAPPITY